jgi:hypothetical protein
MKVTKLDRRHAGKIAFDYFITPDKTNAQENPLTIHKWRVWCWENLGPGAERDVAVRLYMNDNPLRFAWDTEHGHHRLYLKEEDLTFFKLKWG